MCFWDFSYYCWEYCGIITDTKEKPRNKSWSATELASPDVGDTSKMGQIPSPPSTIYPLKFTEPERCLGGDHRLRAPPHYYVFIIHMRSCISCLMLYLSLCFYCKPSLHAKFHLWDNMFFKLPCGGGGWSPSALFMQLHSEENSVRRSGKVKIWIIVLLHIARWWGRQKSCCLLNCGITGPGSVGGLFVAL